MGNYIPVRTSRKRTGSEANLDGEADQDDIAKSRKRYCYQLPVGVAGVPFHDGYLIPKISSSIDDVVPIAASKRQIPICCNGQITDDDTRKVKTSFEKQNITE